MVVLFPGFLVWCPFRKLHCTLPCLQRKVKTNTHSPAPDHILTSCGLKCASMFESYGCVPSVIALMTYPAQCVVDITIILIVYRGSVWILAGFPFLPRIKSCGCLWIWWMCNGESQPSPESSSKDWWYFERGCMREILQLHTCARIQDHELFNFPKFLRNFLLCQQSILQEIGFWQDLARYLRSCLAGISCKKNLVKTQQPHMSERPKDCHGENKANTMGQVAIKNFHLCCASLHANATLCLSGCKCVSWAQMLFGGSYCMGMSKGQPAGTCFYFSASHIALSLAPFDLFLSEDYWLGRVSTDFCLITPFKSNTISKGGTHISSGTI